MRNFTQPQVDLIQSFKVFLQLVRRDVIVLRSRLRSFFWDNAAMLCVNVFQFGYLMPRLGMHKHLIIPIFIGTVLLSFFQVGYGLATRLVADIKFNRFIDYHLSLPLSFPWLLALYIVRFSMEIIIITLPMLLVGIFWLSGTALFVSMATSTGGFNPLGFLLIYLLTVLLFSILFLFFGITCEYKWFFSNIWTRRIEPLFLFGAVLIVWKKLYAFSQFWGIVFLFNPVTYAGEGLRMSLVGGDAFLPLWVCIIGVSVSIGILLLLLVPGAKRALDGV